MTVVTTTVHVKLDQDADGIWYASSDDVFGLNLCGRNRNAVLRDIPAALELLYRENRGVNVLVKELSDPTVFPRPKPMSDQYVLEARPAAVPA